MTYCFSRAYQAAISNMDGVGGKPGWAWIFILEGLATIVAGAASFFIIQDFPDTARFLSEAERAFVIRRLQSDEQFSAGGEKFKLRNIIGSLKDWKTWLGSKLGLSVTLSNARLPWAHRCHYSSWYVYGLGHAFVRPCAIPSEHHS
jgi:hypothetical protein